MSHSLSKLYVHLIFHVKDEQKFIRPEDEKELYAYMGGIIKQTSSEPIKIGGVENHVHVLVNMSKNISLSKFLEEIKKNSSRWIKTKGVHYKDFAWQCGYSGYGHKYVAPIGAQFIRCLHCPRRCRGLICVALSAQISLI
jgi:REP element-mobilizing transposase RayT